MLSNARSYSTDGAGSSHDGCAFQQPGGDTLCMETRSGDKRHDLHMQNDTWTSIGTSTPIWLPQVKDGDILSRWTPLTRRWHQMVLRGLLRQMVGCGERLT